MNMKDRVGGVDVALYVVDIILGSNIDIGQSTPELLAVLLKIMRRVSLFDRECFND